MEYSGQERRRHKRMPISARVTVKEAGLTNYYFTRDISAGGAGLISETPIPLGEKIVLEFGISGVQKLIKVDGKVVRHFSEPDPGFGVVFTRFKPHSRKRLEKALENLVKT